MARGQSKWAAALASGMQDFVAPDVVDDEVAAIRGKHAADVTSAGGGLHWVRLSELQPSPDQPRVAEEEIEELATQIAADGLLQPPQVRRTATGFRIVFGHRRVAALRRLAAQPAARRAAAAIADGEPFLRLGRTPAETEVAVRVVEIDDLTALKRTVSENLARLDLAPFEQVVAIATLKAALAGAGADASLRSGLVPALGLAKHKIERPHYVAERLTPEVLVVAGVLAADERDLRRASPALRALSIDALRRVVDAGGLDAQARALVQELARARPAKSTDAGAVAEPAPRAYGLRIVVRGDLRRLPPAKAAGYAVELAEALTELLDVAGRALTAEQVTRLAAVATRLGKTRAPGERPRGRTS